MAGRWGVVIRASLIALSAALTVLVLVGPAGAKKAAAQSAATAEYTVCGYTYTGAGSPPSDCLTLSAAIAASNSLPIGETVRFHMLPGAYCPLLLYGAWHSYVFEGVGLQALSSAERATFVGPEASLTEFKDGPSCSHNATTVQFAGEDAGAPSYTLENLTIDATGADTGLSISGTTTIHTADVIVENAVSRGVHIIGTQPVDLSDLEIVNDGTGVVFDGPGELVNSTVYGNQIGVRLFSQTDGIWQVSLVSDTITGNGTGVTQTWPTGSLQVLNTINAGNSTHDCSGTTAWETALAPSSANLVGADCGAGDGHDIVYDDADGAFADGPSLNGGPTPSFLPVPQAEDAATAPCGSRGQDQRHGLIPSGDTCDIGSTQAAADTTPAIDTGLVDLGDIPTGQLATSSISIANSGGDLLGIIGFDVTGTGWSIEDTACTFPLLIDGDTSHACSVTVGFSGSTVGSFPGTLTVHTTDGDEQYSLAATTHAAPGLGAAPTALSFPTTNEGSVTESRTVTLTGSGSQPIAISAIGIVGDAASEFRLKYSCGKTLAPGAQCTVSVRFAPVWSGTRTATLEVRDDAPEPTQDIPLTGTSIGPTASLEFNPLYFGSQKVGTVSRPLSERVLNTSTTLPLVVSHVVSRNGSSAATGCAGKIPPGKSCSLRVVFSPTVAGDIHDSLDLTTNSGTPLTIEVFGTGAQADLDVDNTSRDFSYQAVGTTSTAPRDIVIRNQGDAPAILKTVKVTGADAGQFKLRGSCPKSLAADHECSFAVSFKPTRVGSFTAAVTVVSDADNSPQTVDLSGIGVPVPTATLTPSSLTFAPTPTGTRSATQFLTLTNTSTSVLTVYTVRPPEEFGLPGAGDTCDGAVLLAGQTCTLPVLFSPYKKGTQSGSVEITDDAKGGKQTVRVTGTGT